MHKLPYLLVVLLCIIPFVQTAAAQIINVTSSPVCFLNETAGPWVWRDCGVDDDYLVAALLPFEWITGGHFSMIVVSVFVMFTYIKYHKVIYPLITGAMFLPISYFLFPETFIIWAIIMGFVGVGMVAAYVILKATKEY